MKIDEEVAIFEAATAGDVAAQLQYGKMLCGFADRVVEGLNGVEAARYWDISNEGVEWLVKAAKSGSKVAEKSVARKTFRQRIAERKKHLANCG